MNINARLMHGLQPSAEDWRDYQLTPVGAAGVLPREYTNPKIKNIHIDDQGDVNACMAFEAAYALGATNGGRFSTGFLYGHRPPGTWQGPGMVMAQALDMLHNIGDVPHEKYPRNVEMPAARAFLSAKFETLKDQAAAYTIDGYARVVGDSQIKLAVTQHMPVLVCAYIGPDFKPNKDGIAELSKSGDGFAHAMGIYGYSIIRGTEYWRMANSWGRKWGLDGFCYCRIGSPFGESWAIADDAQQVCAPQPQKERPTLRLKHPVMKDAHGRTDIAELQETLNRQGYRTLELRDLRVTGVYDIDTEFAARKFQQAHKLKVDGIVGPITWGELGV